MAQRSVPKGAALVAFLLSAMGVWFVAGFAVDCDNDYGSCATPADHSVHDDFAMLQHRVTFGATLQPTQWHAHADRLPNMQRTVAALQKLASAVVNGTETISDTERQVLDGIREDIATMTNSSFIDHHEDQGEVDRAHDLVKECEETLPDVENKETSLSAEESHAQCRIAQQDLKATKATRCEAYLDAAMNQDEPPDCFQNYNSRPSEEAIEAMHTCLRQITAWAAVLNESLAEKLDACDAATQNHIDKVQECNKLQTTYEDAFCDYREELVNGCFSYSNCRSRRTATQEQVHSEVQVAEAGRKSEFAAAEHINCLLDIFETSAGEQPQKLQYCTDASPNVSAFSITYHGTPAASDCSTEPVTTYPCMSQWLTDHYETKSWYSEAPTIACTVCAIAPAPTPALAPTPAPTPALAPTPAPAPAVCPSLDFNDDVVGECPQGWTCSAASSKVREPSARRRAADSAQGNWFDVGNDDDLAEADSDSFLLPAGVDKMQVLRTGGATQGGSEIAVRRQADDAVLCSSTNNPQGMRLQLDTTCDGLSPHAGERVYIHVEDGQTGGWGKVYIDEIKFVDASNDPIPLECI